MSWNSYSTRWEVTISTSSCESTVEVVSSASGGGGSQKDLVNITRADYDSKRGRLTFYAENSPGNATTLTVSYDGSNYQMDWDSSDNRWEIVISSSSCNDSSIDVFLLQGAAVPAVSVVAAVMIVNSI